MMMIIFVSEQRWRPSTKQGLIDDNSGDLFMVVKACVKLITLFGWADNKKVMKIVMMMWKT